MNRTAKLFVAACLMLPSLAVAEPPKAQLADEDKAFIEEAAQGGMAEVQLGELAQKNAADPAVKKYGAQMVKDHSRANAKLEKLAKQKGVALPTKLSDDMQKEAYELAKKSGADFDKAYIDLMEEDHSKDVDKFKDYVDKGKDADLKKFARESLPLLRTHHMMAKTTHAKHTR